MKFNSIRNIIKVIIIGIFLLILITFLYRYFAIGGSFTANYDFSHKATYISELEPSGRVWGREHNLSSNEYYQRVLADPVYFTAQVPRSYDSALVTIEYTNPEQSLVELGIEKYGEGNFELKPFEFKALDNLDWNIIEEDGRALYQKENKFETIGDFEKNLPTDGKIGTYHYNLNPKININDYVPSDQVKEIPLGLIGTHEFVFYLSEGEDAYLQFNFRHIDEQGDTSPINLKVKKGGVELVNESFQENAKEMDLVGLGPGMVSVSITASENTKIDHLKTNLQKMVLKNKIYPADSEDVELFTNSVDVNFRPWIASGLQTIQINDQDLVLNKVMKLFNWRDNEEKNIILPEGNLEIIGDGYFALDQDMFFNPDANIEKLKYYSDINSFDYIIVGNYQSPEESKDRITAMSEFNLEGVPGDRKELNFVLSAPGLDQVSEKIIVHNINIQLERPSLWQKIFKK
ncbi:hypothetical protein KKC88_04845 [Patescibacteria group bacterium]|nr:hypothetical protein [Patescibacteria group bacterium]MBU1673228.1 hypothetical protein [Patescibacteria group bacterium]MBU1964014.1 hypothetical protein [Patescibacteria group bacterium]